MEAIRAGRTFATNGGPVFPFLTIDGKGPGEMLDPGGDRPHAVRAEIYSLHPLRSARLYRRGEPMTGSSSLFCRISGRDMSFSSEFRRAHNGADWLLLLVQG